MREDAELSDAELAEIGIQIGYQWVPAVLSDLPAVVKPVRKFSCLSRHGRV